VNNVNITNTTVNVTKITNVYNYYNSNNTVNRTQITYANQHVANGVTVVQHDTFVNGRPIGTQTLSVAPREIEQASVMHAPGVEPVRASVMGAGTPTHIAPPATVVNRPVFASRAPAPQSTFNSPAPASNRYPEGTVASRPDRQVPRPPTGDASARASDYRAQPAAQNVSPQGTHPLVRPVPPVQPKTEQQWNDQQSKFQKWQKQREQSAPQPPEHKSDQHSGENHSQSHSEKNSGK
jgi:hypothetical protein